jgi:hypothetical protein
MSNASKLDPGQIIQKLYNEQSNSIPMVDATNGAPTGPWDFVSMVETSGGAVETYTFRNGGPSGDIVKTVVITYTNSTKATLLNVQITNV